jgi:hypothetical protein
MLLLNPAIEESEECEWVNNLERKLVPLFIHILERAYRHTLLTGSMENSNQFTLT